MAKLTRETKFLEKQNLNFIPVYNQTILNIKHTPRTVEPQQRRANT